MPAWINESSGSILLTLHVQPGAKRTEVSGTHGDALKIRLAAPPVDGQANEALLSYLAAQFGVPKRQVEMVSGHTSRKKRVQLTGATLRPDKDW
ncbi:MAG: YggU family protein [Flavobacteriales bacterium]|jgi:hypothetical protein|nr:YggU family protein [Flavobacteriales bacterium]